MGSAGTLCALDSVGPRAFSCTGGKQGGTAEIGVKWWFRVISSAPPPF